MSVPEDHLVPPKRALRYLLASAILALALAAFFAPALLGRGQFLFRDSGRLHHPVKAFVADELRQGRIPQWNPYMGLGVPLAGTAVDAVQHPLNLLLALLPFEVAFKAWVLLCYFLGGLGTFSWARRRGLSFTPALASALAFALSGFLVSSSDNVTYLTAAACVPWLLAAFEAYLSSGGPLRLAGVCLASFLCAAAGDPLTWGVALAILVARGLGPALLRRPRSLPLGRTGLGAAASAAGAAPILLPLMLWLPFTRRIASGLDTTSRTRWDLHPLRILEFVLPSLFESPSGEAHGGVFQAFAGNDATSLPWVASIYAGVACVALAIFAARRSMEARFLLGAGLVVTWAATGHHLGFGWIAGHLPVLKSFRYWEKLTVWPTLFLALAAGIGLGRLLADRRPARPFAIGTGASAALLLLGWAAMRIVPDRLLPAASSSGVTTADTARLLENLQRATGTAGTILLLLSLASVALSRGLLARAGPVVLVGILALDAASANVRAYVLAPPETVLPSAPLARWLGEQRELPRVVTPYELARDRWKERGEFESTWAWGASTFAPAWHVGSRVGNLEVYTALAPERLGRIIREAGAERLTSQVGLWGAQYVVVPGSPALAARSGLRPPFAVAATDPELPAFLVRLPHRPRAYLASDVVSTDAAGALAFALDAASVTSDRTVIEAPVPEAVSGGPPGAATITADRPDRIEVQVQAARRALLVLSDQDAPGWWAEVDGQPRPIVTANYLARGVWIEAGPHRVVFRYRAPGLLAGWAVLATALAAVGAWTLLRRRRRGRAAGVLPTRSRRSRTWPGGSAATGTSG